MIRPINISLCLFQETSQLYKKNVQQLHHLFFLWFLSPKKVEKFIVLGLKVAKQTFLWESSSLLSFLEAQVMGQYSLVLVTVQTNYVKLCF